MNKKLMLEEEINAKVEFLSSAKCNHTFHKYIDITGDLIAGTLLSQILYWFSYNSNGKSKARIIKDGHYWIAKQRSEWWDEIRITERQYDRAVKLLVEKGFVVVGKYKFNSMPTVHIRPNYARINDAIAQWEEQLAEEIKNTSEIVENKSENDDLELHNRQFGNYTKRNSRTTQSVTPLTYITNNDYKQEYGFPSKDEKQVSIYGFSDEKTKNFSENNKSNSDLEDIISNIVMERYPKKYELNLHDELIKVIHEFDRIYYGYFGKHQRLMMHKSYANIVEVFFNPPNCFDGDCNYETLINLVEIYFKTDYNKRGNYKGEIKKSVAHFFNRTILENLYYTYQLNMMKGW